MFHTDNKTIMFKITDFEIDFFFSYNKINQTIEKTQKNKH